MILFDETLRQKAKDGRGLGKVLSDQGVIPGIKVDTGAKPLAGFPEEKITEGLDGLRDRCTEYYQLGARFAKWRAVITIGEHIPSNFCIEANAHALARYAALAQEAGLVPIVEPEVLMDGDHSIERCEEVTTTTLVAVYDALHRHRVNLEGSLLKPNMVVSGKGKCRPGRRRTGGGSDDSNPETYRAGYRTRHCVFVRWAKFGGGHRSPQRHESNWWVPVAAFLLVRSCPAGGRLEGVER